MVSIYPQPPSIFCIYCILISIAIVTTKPKTSVIVTFHSKHMRSNTESIEYSITYDCHWPLY